METQAAFADLQQLRIVDHGDARERAMWSTAADQLSNYEKFWQTFVVLLTNRIDPRMVFGSNEWIRLRANLPRPYEDLAMSNYSAFYYAASVVEQMKDNDARIARGKHYRPELVFVQLQMCVENTKRLHRIAREVLRELGVNCKLPKHQQDCYQTIGVYRNAFAHDPILGRAATHGRELIPPANMLPKTTKPDDFLRWSDIEKIPSHQMIDGLRCQEELWRRLADFLQDTWEVLASAFSTARTTDKFIRDVNLSTLLPIRVVFGGMSTANPFAASGTIVYGHD